MSERKLATPLISVKTKFAWLERLTYDQSLSPLEVRIGLAYGAHVNRFTGETYVSRQTIAKKLGISIKSVDRGSATLEVRKYFEVVRRRGRSLSNIHRLTLPPPACSAAATAETVMEKETTQPANGDKLGHKRGPGGPSDSYTKPIYETRGSAGRLDARQHQQVGEIDAATNDFGFVDAAQSAGCVFVLEGSKPHLSWLRDRASQGITCGPPIVWSHFNGRMRRGAWLPTLYPRRGHSPPSP